MAINSQTMSAIGNALTKFTESRQKQQTIDKTASTKSGMSTKDAIIFSILQKQGLIDANAMAQFGGPQSVPQGTRQVQAQQGIQPGRGVNVPFTPNVMASAGIKEDPNVIANRGIATDVAKQEAMLEGELEKTEKSAAAQKAGAGLSGESAGKLTMLQQASSDVSELSDLMFDDKGKLNRLEIISSKLPGGGIGDTARKISSRMGNALSAKLRSETGAAATKEERKKIEDIFEVSGILDSPESAKDKLDRLQDFMDNAIVTTDPSGNFVYKTNDSGLNVLLNIPSAKLERAKKAGFSNEDIIKYFGG